MKIIFLILLFGIFSIGFADSYAQFPGSVKAFKYKPTMVPYVCGDKFIEGTDCQAETPPLMQYKQGITSEKISCKKGLDLVLKNSDYSPACVTPSSVKILVERGWTRTIVSEENLQEPADPVITSLIREIGAGPFALANESFLMRDHAPSITITLSKISGQAVMVFKGTGFREFHVIDFIITNEQGFKENIETQTTRFTGDLDMPWIIPQSMKSGEYDILITDQTSYHHLKINL